MIRKKSQDKLVMFFGMLNIWKLVDILPFKQLTRAENTIEKRFAYLKSKSVALTCSGWSRVFGSNHATIEQNPAGQINCIGVWLSAD